MDIAKFNKDLSYRVAKATGLEKNHKIIEAIDEWFDISEMVIRASKSPKLAFSYKSMLIDKTKQIIEHIKSLKLQLVKERKIAAIEKTADFQEKLDINNESVENKAHNMESEIKDQSIEKEDKSKSPKINAKIIEDSEFKNLPKGFKEIKAAKDFEIITPHNKNHVEKVKREGISSVKEDNSLINQMPEINLNHNLRSDKIICFACGAELPIKTKVCPDCGTILKK